MSDIRKIHQKLPADFADLLLRVADEEGRDRLDSLLANANTNGWTLTALAEPFGWTREWVRLRVQRARPAAGLPSVPLPPKHPTPTPTPDRRLRLRDEQIAELREMAAIAGTVNGALEPEHSARRVGEHFTAQLAAYVGQGVTIAYLAQVLGVTHGAIASRLARHGYRDPHPSQAHEMYRNRKSGGRSDSGACGRGHDLAGDNLRITNPGGTRVCRACERIRGAAYRTRVQQAQPDPSMEATA